MQESISIPSVTVSYALHETERLETVFELYTRMGASTDRQKSKISARRSVSEITKGVISENYAVSEITIVRLNKSH